MFYPQIIYSMTINRLKYKNTFKYIGKIEYNDCSFLVKMLPAKCLQLDLLYIIFFFQLNC